MILAAASEVLKTMLYGRLPEEKDIEIVDASAIAFTEFKRFIHTNELHLTAETVADVMNFSLSKDKKIKYFLFIKLSNYFHFLFSTIIEFV